MNQVKYFFILYFLFTNFISFSQTYIEPITSERSTGVLANGADLMTLETIIGDSRFAIPTKIWNAIYTPDGKFIIVSGYSYVACFEQETGKRVWQHFLDYDARSTTYYCVRALAVHQEKNRLVVGSDKGKVYQLNLKTGAIEHVLMEKMGWIMAVTLSPNGRFAAVTDIQGIYKMWDLEKNKPVTLPQMETTRGEAVCFSSDGKFLAVGVNQGFYLIDWDNQTAEKYDAPSTVQSLAFINGDREVLISGWTGFLQRIHLKSKEVLWKSGVEDWLVNIKILPDQTSALAISPFYVLHLDWENNQITRTNLPTRTAMDLHPDGKTILTIGSFANRIEQFDWKKEKPIFNSNLYTEPPMKLAFSPNGKYLAAGSYFTADKGVFWNTDTWEIVGTIEGNKQHGYENFEFTADGKYFHATMRQNNIRIPIDNIPTYFEVPSFLPAKNKFIENRKLNPYHHTAVNLESINTAHLKSELPIKTSAFFGNLDNSLNRHLFGGWTIENAYFAGVTNENILYIFETKTGKKVAGVPLPDYSVVACAIHPEAKIVAVTAWDGLIYIYRWDIKY